MSQSIKAAKIISIDESASGAKAGLKYGDLVHAYNGIPVESPIWLQEQMEYSANAAKVYLSVLRNGKIVEIACPGGDLGFSVGSVRDYDADLAVPVDRIDIIENIRKEEKTSSVIVSTLPRLEGFEIAGHGEIVTSECVFGMNVFKDLLTQLRDVFGGRSTTVQKAMRQGKDFVIEELRKQAFEQGCNAVIGVHITYNELSGQGNQMLMICASGTAIKAVSSSKK